MPTTKTLRVEGERPPHVDASARCLNGWWDFLPICLTEGQPAAEDCLQPGSGAAWAKEAYLVPSVWTKSPEGCREPGERFFRMRTGSDPVADAAAAAETTEWLFDAYDYPLDWHRHRSAWVRRSFDIHPRAGMRYQLCLEGVLARCRVFLNGRDLGGHDDAMLPGEWDLTEALRPGTNQLAVLVLDYQRSADDRRKTLHPSGNKFTQQHLGIWQDVWLRERPEIRVAEVTLRPSTRRRELACELTVVNDSAEDFNGSLCLDAVRWRKGCEAWDDAGEKTFPETNVSVAAVGREVVRTNLAWPEADWWSPDSPVLYWFRSRLVGGAGEMDRHVERFGFREVWIEGHELMLNDHPIHLFSDWGHKVTPYHHTERWIRQWFAMLRDTNGNHSRLHTHPHPRLYLDLADEEGILITGETGLHGSGGSQAADEPTYWENARAHVRRFIARDKNHPCIVLWSCENEMRHNRDRTPRTWEELPKLRALMEALDPTRPVYHDGDSGLWNESRQPAISRHYGKVCAGWGWWDKTRPLFASEMAVYHYLSPGMVYALGGSEVYASYAKACEAAGRDTEWIVEAGRVNGVACFGPWNLSCLMNHRPHAERVELRYDDWEAPGVKPLAVPPHASEFAFWEDGPGYAPSAANEAQARGFRPFAVIDLNRSGQVLAGRLFRRTLHVVNDSAGPQAGEVVWALRDADRTVCAGRLPLEVGRGRRQSVELEGKLPASVGGASLRYSVAFETDSGECLDRWERMIGAHPDLFASAGSPAVIDDGREWAVYGDGGLRGALEAAGRRCRYLETLAGLDPAEAPLLVIEKDAVTAGSTLNREVADYLEKGGRVLLMEQSVSLFPALALAPVGCQLAWRTAAPGHPLMDGLDDSLFRFWGDEPYVDDSGGNFVAERLYAKDGLEVMHPLLEGGEADSRKCDTPDWTPLFESPVGEGLVVACQLRVSECLRDRAEAQAVFLGLLGYLETAPLPKHAECIESSDTDGVPDAVARARSGATVFVEGADADALAEWSAALGVALRPAAEDAVYQGVRKGVPPALSGIGEADLCGVLRRNYGIQRPLTRLTGRPLRPAEGLEAWVATPTESLLRELFAEGGMTEPLRAHTASRFLCAEKREEAVLAGSVACGRGHVVFDQFIPEAGEGAARLRRLRNRLRANLGGAGRDGRLLAGASVRAPETGASQGFPTWAYVLAEAASEEDLAEMTELTQAQGDRVANTIHLKRYPFEKVDAPDGSFAARARPTVICSHPRSPEVRKTGGQELGLPDPKALTFLELEGEGSARLILNGQDRGTADFADGKLVFSELPMEKGVNWMLLVWWPENVPEEAAPLRLRWKNFDGEPETDFDFE